MATPHKSRLGRGLGAIISGGTAKTATKAPADLKSEISDSKSKAPPAAPVAAHVASAPAPAPSAPGYQEIPVGSVVPNPYQPRREFHPDHIKELADSIAAEGLLQPIVVRLVDGKYQLIAGERRWRAFQSLKLKSIPARIVQAGNSSAATMALIENLQREGLNPIEEAHGYASLIRDFDLTQEAVSERVGKGRATIANSLRLLVLEAEVQGFLGSGMLSTGHAKVLLGLDNKQEQLLIARRIIEDGLSVRATEALVEGIRKGGGNRAAGGRHVPPAEATAIADIERRLTSFLNARVLLKHARKKGRIVIEYQGNEDLQRILEKVGVGS
ncbi:MAG: ParB/RepB/Spo0J family partition protein [Opitutaceae bacterium]|nr:ParB/RepB/Spo0J family partition protein [Opitutaceae bacterium]